MNSTASTYTDVPGATTVRELIEARPGNRRQWAIAFLVLLALVLDGLDLLLLAFVAPLMTAEWQVDRSAFGYALSAALITMALGAYFGGRAGDRFGRKLVLVLSVIGFAVATIATTYVSGLNELIILRLLGGLGFGAATPNGIALATAWLPRRHFTAIAAAISVASPLGGILAGYLTLWLAPVAGWRGCFLASGCLAMLVGLAIIIWVPEGADFDLKKGRAVGARKSLGRILADVPRDQLARLAEASDAAMRQTKLFTRSRLRFHLGMGVGFFFCSYVTFAFSSWATTLLTVQGLSFEDAALGYLSYNILCVVSAFVLPVVLNWFGSRVSMGLAAALSVTMLILVATADHIIHDTAHRSLVMMFWFAAAGVGLGQGLLNAAFYAVISHAYPTELRAGGSGFAMMVNRVGGFVAIIISGYAMSVPQEGSLIFLSELCLALIFASVGVAVIDRHISRRSSDHSGRSSEEAGSIASARVYGAEK